MEAETDHCPGRACFELLGKKWSTLIVWALRDGPLRFSELMNEVPGVSDRMLSRRLDDLARAGVITRTHHPEIPPRVVYELTESGRGLEPVIAEMERWSIHFADGDSIGSRIETAQPFEVGPAKK